MRGSTGWSLEPGSGSGVAEVVARFRFDADRPRVAGAVPPPSLIEQRYYRQQRQRQVTLETMVRRAVGPILRKFGPRYTAREKAQRTDSLESELLSQLMAAIGGVRAGFDLIAPVDEDDLRAIARAIDLYTTTQTLKTIAQVAAIDVSTSALAVAEEAWTLNQSRLLAQLTADEFSDLERHIFDAVVQGKTPRQVAKELEGRLDISKRRLEFITTNETENFNAAITKKRQTDLGIDSYMWSTSGDQRVRLTHRALDRTTHRWDDPPNIPDEGPLHPGQPIRCRCVAQAVIDNEVPPPEYKDERSLDKAVRGGTASWSDPTRTA